MDPMNDPPSPTLIPKPLAFKKKPASIAGPPPQYNKELPIRPRHESAPCYSKDHPSMGDILFHESSAYPDVPAHCNGKNSRNLSLVLQKRTIKSSASKRYEPVHEISPIPSRIGELRPHYERGSAAKISGSSIHVKRKPSPQEIRKCLLSEAEDINQVPTIPTVAPPSLHPAFLAPPTPIEKDVPAHTQPTHSNTSLKPLALATKFRVINGKAIRAGPPPHNEPSQPSISETRQRPPPLDESLIHPALRSDFTSQGEIRYFAPRPHDMDKKSMIERPLNYTNKSSRHVTDTKHSVSFIPGSGPGVPMHPAHSKTTSITVNEVSECESPHWAKRGFLPKRIPGLQQWIK